MVEIGCEPADACTVDQPAFKAFLTRWLAVTAQLVPQFYERIFSYLRKSAIGAAGQCSGGSTGQVCGREWNTTVWDGHSGVGEQMSALAVVQAMLIDVENLDAPVTSDTGGTSKGDSSAGTGSSSSSSSSSSSDDDDLEEIATRTITTSDKAAAGVVTSLIVFSFTIGAWWMLFVN